MAKNKNQKRYNKAVLDSAMMSNKYLNESLTNLNNYVNNYSDRLDHWAEKLNNRQLDLLSDEYLATNANMLRNMASFGTNSETNRKIEQNAYDQSNYLANVHNTNIQAANQLQNNELSWLYNNANINMQNRQYGQQAAQNLDKMSNSWLNILGGGLEAVGTIGGTLLAPVTGGASIGIGQAVSGIGSTISSLANPAVTQYNQMQYGTNISPTAFNRFYSAGKRLSTRDNNSDSTLSNADQYNMYTLSGALQAATQPNNSLLKASSIFGN